MDPAILAGIQRRRRPTHHLSRTDQVSAHYLRMNNRRRRNITLLTLLVDLVVARLDGTLTSALGITTGAHQIVLGRATQRHIIKRRQVASNADVALAAHRIGEALADLRYEVLPRDNPDEVNLVGYVGSQQRYLEVVLKFVPASRSPSSVDECWVKTAFPKGSQPMRGLRRRNCLKSL